MLDRTDPVVVDVDERRSLRTRLTGVSSLKVAGKDDVLVVGDNYLALVNVTERPVVISAGPQPFWSAWCVGVVIWTSCEGCVKDTDIEQIGNWGGLGSGQVLGDYSLFVALTVNREANVVEGDRLGLKVTKYVHARRGPEPLRDLARGIVISVRDDHLHARVHQSGELPIQKDRGVVVVAVAVIEVAGNQ